MTTGEALYNFFNSFGITAYPTTSVPDDVVFPYMTYDYYDGFFGDAEQSITASLWFYTTSELIPNKKADEIAVAIGRGGKVVACDSGAIWLKRGEPWCNALLDDGDTSIKRRLLNITAEFLKG